MADTDWGELENAVQVRLQAEKVKPVPAPIVKLAQRAVDGLPHPTALDEHGKPVLIHTLQWEAPTVERAQAFAAHMKNAGAHTTPKASIRVKMDPDRKLIPQLDPETGDPVVNSEGKPVKVPGEPVNPRLVAFQAGARRGKSVANGS